MPSWRPETVGAPCCYHVSGNATSELRSAEFLPPSLESLRGRFACADGYGLLEVACRDNARVRGWPMAAIVAVCAAQITNNLRHLGYAASCAWRQNHSSGSAASNVIDGEFL